MQPTSKIIILLFICCSPLLGALTEYAFSEIPSSFHSNQLSVGSRAIGELCYSRKTMPDGSICSPSLLSENTENSLLFQMYLGNGYGALSTANNFINKSLTKEFLEQTFRNQNSTSVDANAGLVFTAKYFSAFFQPYRIQYVSEVHNPNFPVVGVHVANERRLGIAGGVPLKWIAPALDRFSFGLSVKAFERKYMHGSFSLFQALAEEPNSFLPVKSQTGILAEPVLSYQEPEVWALLGTISVSNLGPVWGVDPAYPNQKDINLGIGVNPPIGFGQFGVGIDIVNVLYAKTLLERFRLGTSYKLGAMEVMSGVTRDYLSLGIQYQISVIQAGIVYEFLTHEYGGFREKNKIGTEISVRL